MPGIGSVGYEFRMAQVPVTVGQYFEFVQAYLPFYESRGVNVDFTGDWMSVDLVGNLHPPQPQWMNYPATPSFEYAARFVNWLHNGKVNEAWAFEGGVYDTATFTENPDGSYNHDTTPAPGATVWMPTLDEYTKAFHYDPGKNGDGQDGYWLYPHSSDSPPVPGLPSEGGETDAGDPDYLFLFQDVGSYPWAASPWGLLDSSGGEREWTTSSAFPGLLYVPDSGRAGGLTSDRLDFSADWPAEFFGNAFRLVIPVPGPSVLPAIVGVMVLSLRRKGRTDADEARGGNRGGRGVHM